MIDGNNLEVFKADGVSKHYVLETYKHLKPIVFLGDKCALIDEFQLTKDAALFSTQNFKRDPRSIQTSYSKSPFVG